jgi:hypothetical protein
MRGSAASFVSKEVLVPLHGPRTDRLGMADKTGLNRGRGFDSSPFLRVHFP